MLDFPYCPVSSELRSLKRYQSSLVRHRKLRETALNGKVV